jgi:hypothetical protein
MVQTIDAQGSSQHWVWRYWGRTLLSSTAATWQQLFGAGRFSIWLLVVNFNFSFLIGL